MTVKMGYRQQSVHLESLTCTHVLLVSTSQLARPSPIHRRRSTTPAVITNTDATDTTHTIAEQPVIPGPSDTSSQALTLPNSESTSDIMSYTVSDLAYTKIILHALKHPHQPVNGVLLGSIPSSSAVEIVDTIPLLHHWTSLSPMMEIGLDLVRVLSLTQLPITFWPPLLCFCAIRDALCG